MQNNTELSLLLGNSELLSRQAVAQIMACDAQYGAGSLRLNERQAALLVSVREESLKKCGRVEFGGGVIEQLMRAFCDSPNIQQADYAQTLAELIDLFYAFKNETMDAVSDARLIAFMREAFDGPCGGSVELLAGQALAQLARHICAGKGIGSFHLNREDGL